MRIKFLFCLGFILFSSCAISDQNNVNYSATATDSVPEYSSPPENTKPISGLSLDSTGTLELKLNSDIPDDILAHFYFALGGGGDTCPFNLSSIEFTESILDLPDYEITDVLPLVSCGWEEGEQVSITVNFPDGKKEVLTRQASWSMVDLYYETNVNDPIGEYRFVFEGRSGKAEKSFMVSNSDNPRLYVDKNGDVFIMNFAPEEEVRLVAYHKSAPKDFVGWQMLYVDTSGQLKIIGNSEYMYVVIGEISGEVFQYSIITRYIHFADLLWESSVVCQTDIKSQIFDMNYGDGVAVISEQSLEVHVDPDDGSEVVGLLEPGSIITGRFGLNPLCKNRSIWWFVSDEYGVSGWVKEVEKSQYLLAPIDEQITKTQPAFNHFYSCLESCKNDGTNSINSFPEKTTKVFLYWDYDNIPKNADYERIWSMGDRVWARYDCTWTGESSGIENKITLTEPAGLASGVWTITIKINGDVVLKNDIVINGNWDYWDPAGEFDTCYGKR